jgi:hypothetical protein
MSKQRFCSKSVPERNDIFIHLATLPLEEEGGGVEDVFKPGGICGASHLHLDEGERIERRKKKGVRAFCGDCFVYSRNVSSIFSNNVLASGYVSPPPRAKAQFPQDGLREKKHLSTDGNMLR